MWNKYNNNFLDLWENETATARTLLVVVFFFSLHRQWRNKRIQDAMHLKRVCT